MKKIVLSGKVPEGRYVIVDDVDFAYLSTIKWFWGPTSTYAWGYLPGTKTKGLIP